MTKFLPYQQYDLLAIENWLNKHAQRGLRLEKMDGVFPKFRKNYDRMVYYRVRYAPTDAPKGYSHYWGKLYIYEAESKAELPNPSYEKGSMMAARDQKTPWYAAALLIAMVYVAVILARQLSTAEPGYLVCGAVSVVAMLVWLVCIFQAWRRGRSIADGTLDPAAAPPSPKAKTALTLSSIIAFTFTLLTVVIGEGFI